MGLCTFIGRTVVYGTIPAIICYHIGYKHGYEAKQIEKVSHIEQIITNHIPLKTMGGKQNG